VLKNRRGEKGGGGGGARRFSSLKPALSRSGRRGRTINAQRRRKKPPDFYFNSDIVAAKAVSLGKNGQQIVFFSQKQAEGRKSFHERKKERKQRKLFPPDQGEKEDKGGSCQENDVRTREKKKTGRS